MSSHFLQSIAIRLINESFETVNDYDGNFAYITEHYLANEHTDRSQYPFLGSIDPYGNAFFNDIQVPKLIDELRRFQKEPENVEIVKDIDDSIEYLNTISDLLYIQFMGD